MSENEQAQSYQSSSPYSSATTLSDANSVNNQAIEEAEIKQRKKKSVKDIDDDIKKLKARKRALLARESDAKKAKRTNRLCNIGGIIEKYCGIITNEEAFEAYVNKYSAAIKGTQSSQLNE